jgi:hypothetical protein
MARPRKTRRNLYHTDEGNPDARARRPVGGGRSRAIAAFFWGKKRQRVAANADATDDAVARAVAFFQARLSAQR